LNARGDEFSKVSRRKRKEMIKEMKERGKRKKVVR